MVLLSWGSPQPADLPGNNLNAIETLEPTNTNSGAHADLLTQALWGSQMMLMNGKVWRFGWEDLAILTLRLT